MDETARIETSGGTITIALDRALAPKAVANFIAYAREGHFDGTMYIPMRSAAAMQVVRQRALELHHTLEVLAEHEQ